MEKAKGLDKEVRRYLVGFMFIILGVFIVSAVSYIASVIPKIVLSPEGNIVNTTSPLGTPQRVVFGSLSGSSVELYFDPIEPATNQNLLVIVDITNITNPDVIDMQVSVYPYQPSPGVTVWNYGWVSTTFYKDSMNGGVFAWCYSVKKTNGVKVFFNSSHVAFLTAYVFIVDSSANITVSEIAPSLSYYPPSIANTLFINFIGWAFGIMFVAIGITRLGIKI